MECYLSRHAMPISDAIIPEIIARVGKYLPRAVADSSDISKPEGAKALVEKALDTFGGKALLPAPDAGLRSARRRNCL